MATATIVNPRHDRGPASGVTPPGYGYLLIGASIARGLVEGRSLCLIHGCISTVALLL